MQIKAYCFSDGLNWMWLFVLVESLVMKVQMQTV